MQYGLHQHRFGVNYTPTRAWWDCWNDFKADAIARDLDAIAELGADHIRIMLLWPSFQPNPRIVSAAHLNRLGELMTLAEQRGIDVCVTLFTGWLSGFAFKPAWQSHATFYDLAASAAAQHRYVDAVAEVVGTRPNFLGFDLGNELGCCWRTEAEKGDAWSRHMLERATARAPAGVHVNGVDHVAWFQPCSFSPGHLAREQALATLHCWPLFTGALERSGGNAEHPRVTDLLAGMTRLARAYAGDAAKPVWVQEFGMSEDWMPAAKIPGFLTQSTLAAIDAGTSWFTWWCSHDLDRAYEFHPLEYSLGLIGHDNRLKPAGLAFRELARAWRGKPVVTKAADPAAPPAEHSLDATWRWLDAQRVA